MIDVPMQTPAQRSVRAAVKRGFNLKCPSCGESRLLHNYIKVHKECDACHEDPFHQRADDELAYLTILVVAYLAGFALHWNYANYLLEPLCVALGITFGTTTLTHSLWPRMKGLMVGMQWAKWMHGFGQ